MGLHVVTPSGLHIDQLDGHYVVSKGKQVDVYKTYGAMVTGLTSGTGEKKPKRAKAASKPRKARKARKARRAAAPAAPQPRKRRKARKAKTVRRTKRNAAGQAVNSHGHKRGCKCVVCSPKTRAKAARARKRNARKSSKPRSPRKSKKRGGGGSRGGFPRSVRGYTFGGDPSEMQDRRRPGRPPKAEIYHGNVARFNGGGKRRGYGRGAGSAGLTSRLPKVNPRASLGAGYANFRGSRRGAW
jgi:hypothetical protein